MQQRNLIPLFMYKGSECYEQLHLRMQRLTFELSTFALPACVREHWSYVQVSVGGDYMGTQALLGLSIGPKSRFNCPFCLIPQAHMDQGTDGVARLYPIRDHAQQMKDCCDASFPILAMCAHYVFYVCFLFLSILLCCVASLLLPRAFGCGCTRVALSLLSFVGVAPCACSDVPSSLRPSHRQFATFSLLSTRPSATSHQVMSLSATGTLEDMALLAGSSAAAGGQAVPKLRPGGVNYTSWREEMEVSLFRQNTGGVHTLAMSAASFRELLSNTRQWAAEGRLQALAKLGIKASVPVVAPTSAATAAAGSSASSSSATNTAAQPTDDEKKIMVTLVEQSQRAYSILFMALPDELRTQVSKIGDVPQGFAHGLWMWLERKFQSTEKDSVGELLATWTSLAQEEHESFDAYRARVNHVKTLLECAKEPQSARMYSYILLDKLQPKYESAVLALKAGGQLADADKISGDGERLHQSARARGDAHGEGGGRCNSTRCDHGCRSGQGRRCWIGAVGRQASAIQIRTQVRRPQRWQGVQPRHQMSSMQREGTYRCALSGASTSRACSGGWFQHRHQERRHQCATSTSVRCCRETEVVLQCTE